MVTTVTPGYVQHIDAVAHREGRAVTIKKTCPDCRGTRRPEGRGGVTGAGPAAVDAAGPVQVLCSSIDLGDTVLVIEHDRDVIRAADRNPRRNLSR
ncbi:hypothetical protein [Streptomyces decoyicus]|uniref:hypothetical protein n=1 Tax=Streptomyces decoyicus TaxID=249567 RepID=UPI0036633BA5